MAEQEKVPKEDNGSDITHYEHWSHFLDHYWSRAQKYSMVINPTRVAIEDPVILQ